MRRRQELVRLILNRLEACSCSIRDQWSNPQGTRTRHFFVDELLPNKLCTEIFHAFPRDGNGFFDRDTFREKKKTSADLSKYDPILSDITYAIQDERVVNKIQALIGFSQIDPDPMLYAGGLSMMFKEDYLNPHLDNSHDARRERYRRLNLLYYVSPDWDLDHGGNLELWNDDVTIPKTIVAKTNRLAVMETNRKSWHSVSPVISEVPRCCVSNYYFSKISPDGNNYFHVTSFLGRPGQRLKRVIGMFDNAARNFVSRSFKMGRGKDLVNKNRMDD